MPETILSLKGIHKNFGESEIITGVDLDVFRGERHAIIGPNGAGKSTLFNLVSGLYPVSEGRMELKGHDITKLAPHRINRRGLSRSFQTTNIFPKMSVFENIRCALLWPMGFGHSFWHLCERKKALNDRSRMVLEQIGMADRALMPAGALSYADQRFLEIGITIAGGAEIILLDEPTAGMSRHEIERTVNFIREVTEGKTLVIVEHDMGVVFDLADRISVLVYGQIIATDSPEAIKKNEKVREAYLGKEAV
ncbi:MAG: ABC transporter ATP-binding protein [Desulfobacteraceae bacterium]|nr:ABC transporter ATP-binding protein [Desulfobacteraceae bacterium]